MFVTWKKVREAIQLELIRLINCPNCNEIACQIGEHWFYFDTHDDCEYRQMDAQTYAMRVSIDTIAEMVTDALQVMVNDSPEEFLYYCFFLLESGIQILDGESEQLDTILRSATGRSGSGNPSENHSSAGDQAPGNLQGGPDKHSDYQFP